MRVLWVKAPLLLRGHPPVLAAVVLSIALAALAASAVPLVWSALDAACAERTACLIATHDETASLRADRVWRIEDGHDVD